MLVYRSVWFVTFLLSARPPSPRPLRGAARGQSVVLQKPKKTKKKKKTKKEPAGHPSRAFFLFGRRCLPQASTFQVWRSAEKRAPRFRGKRAPLRRRVEAVSFLWGRVPAVFWGGCRHGR